jgi:hypothetical protein
LLDEDNNLGWLRVSNIEKLTTFPDNVGALDCKRGTVAGSHTLNPSLRELNPQAFHGEANDGAGKFARRS